MRNITQKIILTDTNIITDLSNANILKEFINSDNVYVCDMVKNDEINDKTGNIKSIDFKTVNADNKQLVEAIELANIEKKLSPHDTLNYIIARDNNYILATGDNKLREYAQKNGVEVIRTLKIIKLMKEHNIISNTKAIEACKLLKNCPTTRIPEENINELIKDLEKDSVIV